MAGKGHKDLVAWRKSLQLAKDVYALTEGWPAIEKFGLVSQMRRAAVSVASNIAEGYYRPTKEYKRFLGIARGSLAELETQLAISWQLQYVTMNCIDYMRKCDSAVDEIGKMLWSMIDKLGAK